MNANVFAILILSAIPTPRFTERLPTPRFDVRCEAVVSGWRQIGPEEAHTEPCATCPSGRRYSGLRQRWHYWGATGPWACRLYREGEHIGDFIYDQSPPRWLPRVKMQDPADQRFMDTHHWQLGPSSCWMANCPIHRQWQLVPNAPQPGG